jgi:acetyl-CoA acetyltransferase family protein
MRPSHHTSRTLRDVVIVDAVRSPVGRGHPKRGDLRAIHPADLLGRVFTALIEKSGVDPGAVEHVVAGCVYQIAEQATGIARNAWLSKGLPETAAATTVDTRCGSGQQAVNIAALQIASGVHELVVAGGVEHMGRIGFPVNEEAQRLWGAGHTAELLERYALVPQGVSAELIADRWSISREEMDELALRSHRRAAQATEDGSFRREIVPITTPERVVDTDQGIRPDTSLDALGALAPVFRPQGSVTAGNSSPISDGAAALLLASREAAERLGLTPRARIVDQTTVGVDPVLMLTGPIPATARLLERNGLAIGDLDVIEINEAFASVVIAWAREHDPDMERVNPRGGAMALGHPLGASGARILTTLVHELEDGDGSLGLVTMCCAGGVGTGTLIERL